MNTAKANYNANIIDWYWKMFCGTKTLLPRNVNGNSGVPADRALYFIAIFYMHPMNIQISITPGNGRHPFTYTMTTLFKSFY